MQAGQFSRTHGLRRKLSDPRSAGQSFAASVCSQCTTSDGDSNLASFMRSCDITHTYISSKKVLSQERRKPYSIVVTCISRQKLASRMLHLTWFQESTERKPA